MGRDELRKELANQGQPVMPDVGQIMAFEAGELEDEEVIELFQGLINSGMAWRLQGSYGRTAMVLIEAGYCTPAQH